MKYVYLLRNGSDHYKVGVTNNMTRRLSGLRTSNPTIINTVCCRVVKNAEQVEQRLHTYLSGRRSGGGTEWFLLTPEEALDVAVLINTEPEVPIDKRQVTIESLIAQMRGDYAAMASELREIRSIVHTVSRLKGVPLEQPKIAAPTETTTKETEKNKEPSKPEGPTDEALLLLATDLFKRTGKASTSQLQRHLHIGYGRAARIMDKLEERNMISPGDGARARSVLV